MQQNAILSRLSDSQAGDDCEHYYHYDGYDGGNHEEKVKYPND